MTQVLSVSVTCVTVKKSSKNSTLVRDDLYRTAVSQDGPPGLLCGGLTGDTSLKYSKMVPPSTVLHTPLHGMKLSEKGKHIEKRQVRWCSIRTHVLVNWKQVL
jgi:hypothetical protein